MNNDRARAWCFTLNNYSGEEYSSIEQYCRTVGRYAIIGKERGEQGTPHLQGYISFSSARRFDAVKKGLGSRVHLERARGSADQNRNYCSKEGDFTEFGTIPEKVGGDSLEEKIAKSKRLLDPTVPLDTLVDDGTLNAYSYLLIDKTRMAIAAKGEPFMPDGVRGVWIWGPPGSGKTRHVWETYPGLYEKAQNKWFDGYCGERYILLDDLDTDVLSHYLKRWMDRYPVKGEVKGGTIQLRHYKFIVTSNYSIETLFHSDPVLAQAIRRRCEVIHFDILQ